jgi:hypothetical protein
MNSMPDWIDLRIVSDRSVESGHSSSFELPEQNSLIPGQSSNTTNLGIHDQTAALHWGETLPRARAEFGISSDSAKAASFPLTSA